MSVTLGSRRYYNYHWSFTKFAIQHMPERDSASGPLARPHARLERLQARSIGADHPGTRRYVLEVQMG